MAETEIDVINHCLERKTTSPFWRLCLRYIREDRDTSKLTGMGIAAGLTAEQVELHLELAAEMAPKIDQSAVKRFSRRRATGNTFDEKKARMVRQKAEAEKVAAEISVIIDRFTFGPRTAGKIKALMLDIWRNPEQYADSPAWKALTDDRNT